MQEHNITYNGLNLTVTGEYEPEEATVLYYPDGSGHPGTPASFEIKEVFIQEWNITDAIPLLQLEEIETLILETI